MLRWLFRIILALIVGALGLLAYCSTQIPGADDADDARRVGLVIAAGYPKFDDRATVERTGEGKIYYWAPRSDGRPIVSLFGITSPEDMALIEKLAEQALREVPRAKAIELRYHQRRNLIVHENGSTSPAAQAAFKTITVSRAPNG